MAGAGTVGKPGILDAAEHTRLVRTRRIHEPARQVLSPSNLTQAQASEVLTHIPFYAGWPNAFTALPVFKSVFEGRPQAR